MKEEIATSTAMFLMAGLGWTISLETVKEVSQILSLLVPTFLSIVLFIRKTKNQNNEEKNS